MKKEKNEASKGAPAKATAEVPSAIGSIAPKRECESVENRVESTVAKKQKLNETGNNVIIILSDDEDGSIKNSSSAVDSGDDDDVIIVEPAKTGDGTISINEYLNDEVKAIGEKNAVHLPHMRQHCTKFIFIQDVRSKMMRYDRVNVEEARRGKELNAKHCELCYCFVCDKPVSECENWSTTISSLNSHCHASDKGTNSCYYKSLRESYKHRSTITPTPPLRTNANLEAQQFDHLGRMVNNSMQSPLTLQNDMRHIIGPGPYNPDDEVSKVSKDVTKCRKCGWYNLFRHRNFGATLNTNYMKAAFPPCPLDWCHACGRVASENDFEKDQSSPYKPVEGDVLLGSKEIPFKVKAHDPRKFEKFSKYWKENEGSADWEYDEAEMEYDFFRHRIGKRPTISMILLSIPVTKSDSIPDSGAFEQRVFCLTEPSVNETEALLLDNQDDLKLLRELWPFVSDCFSLGLDITASWNKSERKGVIKVTAHIKAHSLCGGGHCRHRGRDAIFSRLLGCWYNIFPFKLSELTYGIRAKSLPFHEVKNILCYSDTGLIPQRIPRDQRKELSKTFRNKDGVNAYNQEAVAVSKGFSFKASDRTDDCGVVASSDISFGGILQKFASCSLVDDFQNSLQDSKYNNYAGMSAIANKLGVISTHRNIRSSSSQVPLDWYSLRNSHGFASYLDPSEYGFLRNLKHAFQNIVRRCTTMNGLMQQLENLGHTPANHVDGLNVELFDFQREAVGWALEREQEGGVEKFLWTKLPEQSLEVTKGRPKSVQLYYSPVLDLFRVDEPPDVRGGLIAAQMGLGKTIISLSLVLLNPAPALPASGTMTETLTLKNDSRLFDPVQIGAVNQISGDNNPNQAKVFWPPIPALPSGSPKKRGSIISRGTLVVCNVSLVGQWIDEAKSKLKDPGLVYSYHGQNRKRNAIVLAKHALVVTTYAVLQSDAYHHATKSNDPDYCAPCEQIRWWRIICDESHSVRDSNTKNFKALSRLTAANKWCVTGTPMNTTPMDLKSQLNFIGIGYVDKMFSSFSDSMAAAFYGASKRRNRWECNRNACIGPFLYFMQNVMIRHAISQTRRSSNVGIMTLPPKEEKIIYIDLTEEERTEYDNIQKKAIQLYNEVKARGDVNRQYLRLTSALLPLRLACSGGKLDEGQVKRIHLLKSSGPDNHFHFDLDNGTECSICLQPLEEPVATNCAPVPHIFCKECIEGVFSGARTKACPCCRNDIKLSDMRSVVPTLVEKDEKKEAEEPNQDEKPTKKRANQVLTDSDILFRSKFECLLKELIRIRDEEPESKSLVFSQFSTTLQWMKQELPKHGFQFRTLSGDMCMKKRADALREFQNDPPTTIFLLSMRSGAVGINLTQANRVFLMEPAMNPALEAQAIGRIYRLGQRKSVQVIKFVVQNSFESRLVKILKRKYGHATKPTPATSDQGPENSTQGKNECPESNVAGAALGHMKKDKIEMMTEEFDAMFGITEPEDIPDQVIKSQQCMTLKRSPSAGSLDENNEGSESGEDWHSDHYDEDEDDYSYSNGRSRYYCEDDSDDESRGCVFY